jgi:c-di-GMP-binding flagellar brake protein YcgR
LRFTDREQIESQLSAELYRFFNRRNSFRVVPPPDLRIRVAIAASEKGRQLEGRVLDISGGGMALRVPVEAEALLVGTDHIVVFLAIPDHPHRLTMRGVIRNRRVAGPETVQYGIMFDWSALKGTVPEREAIVDFVTKCQRHALRAARS